MSRKKSPKSRKKKKTSLPTTPVQALLQGIILNSLLFQKTSGEDFRVIQASGTSWTSGSSRHFTDGRSPSVVPPCAFPSSSSGAALGVAWTKYDPQKRPEIRWVVWGGPGFCIRKKWPKKKKRIHLGFFASRSGLKTKDHIEMMRSCNLSWKMGAGTIGIDGVPINGPL